MGTVLATRFAFGEELLKIAETNEDFVVFNADTKACGLEKFREKFPHREFSFGITEQTCMCCRWYGFMRHKSLSTFAVFASVRACEQVRTLSAI